MKKPIEESNYEEELESKREKIIGLGELSFRKSYFPQLQRRLAQLERFRTLLEQAGEAIFLVEVPYGNIVDANHTASIYTGLSHHELLKLRLFNLCDEYSAESVRRFFKGSTKTGSDHMILFGSIKSAKGEQTSVESNLQMTTLDGVTYAAVVARDISERKRAEEELIRAKEKAESADRAKTEFLNIASHELRTPLTSINLLLTYIQKRAHKNEPIDPSACVRLEKQVSRLGTLVDDLIDISRLERGALTLHLILDDLNKVVSEAIEVFRLRIPDRQIIAHYTTPPIRLKMDPIRIGQVMDNLLDNAAKYSPSSASIEITIEQIESYVRISVTDYGLGLQEAELSLLFSRFFRSKNDLVRQSPGLGLGLYISKEIIERHGGHMGVRTREGKGSTFFFDLPISSPS